MGFKRKFQTGDKVRVKDPNNSFYKKIGIIKGYSNKYDSYTYQYISDKKVYCVDFEEYSTEFYPYQLEKVEEFNNTDTKSNKLSISDLKPGMKVRIKPNLTEGKSSYVFITKSMVNFSNTIHTIKDVINPQIILTDSRYGWDIDCFSEIIRELKEETTTSEEIKFPLKEGQIVTLLDGEKYQVINNKDLGRCSLCSLGTKGCNDCSICYINGMIGCSRILPAFHYFKLVDSPDSIKKEISVKKESSVKEIGIITKVTFTLNEFKSEKLEHSKFTIL